jgi:hypothetical protein
MRDDLLDAKASVDWAVAQFDSLKRRLISWRENAPYSIVHETDPQTGEKIARLRDTKMPDPLINAEVGAIINSIRSSLDILITSVAARPTGVAPKDAHFPIARDHAEWLSGGYKGHKVIQGLPKAAHTIIEKLEPWRGGNHFLVALHDLDNTRKHRRLIAVSPSIHVVMIQSVTISADKPSIRFDLNIRRFENDTIIARSAPGTKHSNPEISFDVTINEAGPVSGEHVISALDKFAGLADSIIRRFDI